MDGHQAATKTRPKSSDSTDSSAESMGRISGAVDAPPASHLDAKKPSLEIYDKRELIMMSPEEKLKHFESRAQALEDNQEFGACIRDLVRCVALTRLVHGDGHVKLAQAHARLAKAYFLFKGLALQAQKHSSLARELLSLRASISTCREETLQVLTCLLSINLTQGGATLLIAKNLEEAESSFLRGRQIVEELRQIDGINAVEKMQTELEISIGLSRFRDLVFSELQEELEVIYARLYENKRISCWSELYHEEFVNDAILVMTQALAHLHRSVSQLCCERGEFSHRAWNKDVTSALLQIQVQISRFIFEKQRRLEKALSQSAKSLQLLEDLGKPEVTCSVYRDMAGIEEDRGHLERAVEYLTKCLEIQTSLYGPQHKETKATQKAVDALAR